MFYLFIEIMKDKENPFTYPGYGTYFLPDGEFFLDSTITCTNLTLELSATYICEISQHLNNHSTTLASTNTTIEVLGITTAKCAHIS